MKPLQLIAGIAINAAQAGKQRRFRIEAYDGGPLPVDGFSLPVIVDLSSLTFPASIPILIDHTADVEHTIGCTETITSDGQTLVMNGLVTATSTLAMDVVTQADKGQRWQASIGVRVGDLQEVQAGQVIVVNKQTFRGPVFVAHNSQMIETSVLPAGADQTTVVNLAASAAKQKKGTPSMTMTTTAPTFEEWLATLGVDDATLDDANRAALTLAYDATQNPPDTTTTASARINLQASANHQRIAAIERLTVGHREICAKAILDNWSPEKTENAVLKASQRMTSPSNHARTNGGPDSHQVLCASLAMNAGASPAFLAKSYGATVVDAATCLEARGATLRTVMDAVLQRAGVSSPSHTTGDSFIRAAFEASRKLEASGLSTLSLPGILSNSANKLLLEGYESIASTWQNFAAVGNLADFKSASRYRMTAKGEFLELGPGGEIKHLALNSEDTYSNTLKTYATMVSISRTDIINDDLNAFAALPKSIGRLAAVKLEKTVYTLLLGNSGSFFHANNSNYLSGGGSALSISSLTAAEKLFLNRTDNNGDPVMLLPSILLVPTSLSVTANQLTRDLQTIAVGVGASASTVPNGNPHAGRFQPVVSPFLENANLTNYSTTGWYLLAAPQGSSGLIEVGFLNGQTKPTIESGELDFSMLGMSLRGYWDFGVAQQDSRFGVLNAGA